MDDINLLNEKIKKESGFLAPLLGEIDKVIVGQRYLLNRMFIGLLSGGHILIEGVPGLAKTLTAKVVAQAINTKFQRIQFTPDLLPADLIGTLIYNFKENSFITKKGPVFSNIVLADEINRAPAKVQSALLEAMQEKQVTIGENTFKLEEPFIVLATQNPIEQEGTYPLPEAQVDRFMLKLKVGYPNKEEELQILKRMGHTEYELKVSPVIAATDILRARKVVDEVYIDDKVQQYIVDLIFASRAPKDYKLNDLADLIQYGASPRASICITLAAKAYAFIQGRGFVTPHDVKSIGMDVLRHRIILTYEAEAEDVTSEDIIKRLFEEVEVP